MHEKSFHTITALIIALALFAGFHGVKVSAATTTPAALQAKINEKLAQKAALDAENAALQAQIEATDNQANTLQNTLKKLDTTQKKIQSDIKVTQNSISTTQLGIEKTGDEIDATESQIIENKKALSENIRKLSENGDVSFVEALLRYKDITEFWSAVETLQEFETKLRTETEDLQKNEDDLKSKQTDYQNKRVDLSTYQKSLTAQQSITEQTKTAKNKLLSQTKDEEAAYQKQLAENVAKGKAFDEALFQFESEQKANIDQSLLPSIGSAPLSFPLDKVRITQRFGKTVDAKQLYVSGTHNGVDFGTPVGTKVKAAANGVVAGMDNTDEESGCYSYGRWILITYDNGLSSIYAHFSAYMPGIAVGTHVTRGQVVGYSGGLPGAFGSGYSIGPHLHMGLFASDGVKIERYTSSNYCKGVSIPIAEGLNAYLDPLAYLPPLP